MKSAITFALTALVLSGCKINVSGDATVVDVASKKTIAATLSLYSKNTKKPCSVNFRLADPSDETLYELNLDAIYIRDDASNFIDSSLDECSKDSAVVVKATSVDQITGRNTFDKVVRCFNSPNERANGMSGDLRHVRVVTNTIVTHIEGTIIDKASGQTVKTFTADSEPREEAVSGNLNPLNCQ